MFANINSKYNGPSLLAQPPTVQGWLLVVLILLLMASINAYGNKGDGASSTNSEPDTVTNDTVGN